MVGAGRVEAAPAPAYTTTPSHRLLSSAGTGHALRLGQSVFHTKFGEGVIVTLEGRGDDARAQVNFGRHGMKWLQLSIAKLTPI
jgi:DNA helicase-2/ATP-dependent DNA helicase PcrA